MLEQVSQRGGPGVVSIGQRMNIKCPQCDNKNHTLDDFVADINEHQWKREVDTRKKVMAIMNKSREDFTILDEYNAYLEEREELSKH